MELIMKEMNSFILKKSKKVEGLVGEQIKWYKMEYNRKK
jgi:hypothetical protein